jgi:hypothetical protein
MANSEKEVTTRTTMALWIAHKNHNFNHLPYQWYLDVTTYSVK